MNIMNRYKAYLFDLDGTLVDSEKLKGRALVETCILLGGMVDVDAYKTVMGESWESVATHFFKLANIEPDPEEFNTMFKKIYQELLFKELSPNPNIVDLLTKLKKEGKRMGVVSSAPDWMVDQVLSQLALSDFFEIIITKENVTNHKPDPEAYLLAIEKLSLHSSEVLIFEDSEAGLIAAQKANCDTIAFQHEFNSNHDLSLAIDIISDYKEILKGIVSSKFEARGNKK
jgi:HAD superfamily hydrolase (TIGR01509 family)